MSTTPFHDVADELRRLADRVTTLGDQVHTGTYEVPEPPEAPVEPEEPADEPDDEPDDEPSIEDRLAAAQQKQQQS